MLVLHKTSFILTHKTPYIKEKMQPLYSSHDFHVNHFLLLRPFHLHKGISISCIPVRARLCGQISHKRVCFVQQQAVTQRTHGKK